MSRRQHFERSNTAVNMSGPLKDALRQHAYERCRYFFNYAFRMKLMTDYANDARKASFAPNSFVQVTATYQVDTGMRSKDADYYKFFDDDPNIVNKPVTSCGSMDASHFCNLGITTMGQQIFANTVTFERQAQFVYADLTIISGDTRLLPQRVNIGPDRVIDKFHGTFALSLLGAGGPPVTKANLQAYLDGATAAMNTYVDTQDVKGKPGIAACARVYCDCYANDFDNLWAQISEEVLEECEARDVDKDKYVTR